MFAFSPKAKIIVSLRRAVASNSPQDCYNLWFKSLAFLDKKETTSLWMWFFLWRRRRDLNPRYPFGVYTISNRARSASYATSPCCDRYCSQLEYITLFDSICQYLFSVFSFFIFILTLGTHPVCLRRIAVQKNC